MTYLPCRRHAWLPFSWALILLVASVSFLLVQEKQGNYRDLQVTGELDWSPASANSSIEIPSQDQRTQEQDTYKITNLHETTIGQNTSMEDSNLGTTKIPSKAQKSDLISFGTILLLILGFCGAALFILIMKRRLEMARWREYRTHQILRAQDEAFDTSYDEVFDLELVEGSMGGQLT